MSSRRASRPSAVPSAPAAATSPVRGPQTPEQATVGRSKRKVVPVASDADKVLRKCRQLREVIRNEALDSTEMYPAGIPKDIIEVTDLASPQVLEAIESVALTIARQVMNKKGFVLDIPSRASSNQIYVKEWDRIVLGSKRSTRTFLNVKEARKSAITLRGELHILFLGQLWQIVSKLYLFLFYFHQQ